MVIVSICVAVIRQTMTPEILSLRTACELNGVSVGGTHEVFAAMPGGTDEMLCHRQPESDERTELGSPVPVEM